MTARAFGEGDCRPWIDATAPVAMDDVGGLGLAAYAAIAVRVGARVEARADVLASAGLDEAAWAVVEPIWLLRLAAAAQRGDAAVLGAWDAATTAAQDALACGPIPSFEAWAHHLAAIEPGDDPAEAIARGGLSLAGFARAQRAYGARIGADPGLFDALRARVADRLEARRAARTG